MVQFLISVVLAIAGVGLLFLGVVGPLTPPEGLPPVEDMGLYGLLPVVLLGVSTAAMPIKILKAVLTVLMIGAILLLVYLGLALIQ